MLNLVLKLKPLTLIHHQAHKVLSHLQDTDDNFRCLEFHLKSKNVATLFGQGGSVLCGGHLRRSLRIITENDLELRPEHCSFNKSDWPVLYWHHAMFVYPGAESSPEGDKSSKYNLAPALVMDMEQQCSQTRELTAEDL